MQFTKYKLELDGQEYTVNGLDVMRKCIIAFDTAGNSYDVYPTCTKCNRNIAEGYSISIYTNQYYAIMKSKCSCGEMSVFLKWVASPLVNNCQHCNGSGVGWDHAAGKEVAGGCTRCNGTGIA